MAKKPKAEPQTDEEKLRRGGYVWLSYSMDDRPKRFCYATASHFRVEYMSQKDEIERSGRQWWGGEKRPSTKKIVTTWCTHGAWPGVLVFHEGKLRGIQMNPSGSPYVMLLKWWAFETDKDADMADQYEMAHRATSKAKTQRSRGRDQIPF